MATPLALRNTTTNGISVGGQIYYDMVPTFGSAADTAVTDTAASGTQIQVTKDTTNDVEISWVTGRAPAGGFTLTSVDLSIWARESNMNANVGLRARFFERTPGGSETEIGGGPFNDGVELGTAYGEMTWTANVTDTTIEEDNRLVLKLYLTNVGTMASGHTVTISFNAASGTTGDSLITLAETVTFKPDNTTYNQSVDASSSSAATLLKQAGKGASLSNAGTATLAVAKTIVSTIAATVASAATLLRQAGKMAVLSGASAGAMVRQIGKALAVAQSAPVSLARQDSKLLPVTAASAPSLLNLAGKALPLASSVTPILASMVTKLLSGNASGTPDLTIATDKSASATASNSASLASMRLFLATVSATCGSLAALVTIVLKALSTAGTTSAELFRVSGKAVGSNATSLAALGAGRLAVAAMAVVVATAAGLVRSVTKVMASTAGVAAQLTRATARTCTGLIGVVASLISSPSMSGQPGAATVSRAEVGPSVSRSQTAGAPASSSAPTVSLSDEPTGKVTLS